MYSTNPAATVATSYPFTFRVGEIGPTLVIFVVDLLKKRDTNSI